MTWLISDIHGCFYTLQRLLDRIREIDEHPKFVFVGDYGDRGPYTKEVVQLMIEMQSDGAVCIRGNHDEVLDWLLNQKSATDISERVGMGEESVASWWSWNGFIQTLDSYGVSSQKPQTGSSVVDAFRESVPQSHKDFFRELPLSWENDTHFCVHAFLPIHGVEFPLNEWLSKNDTRDIMWARYARNWKTGAISLIEEPGWQKIGVFGHTPASYYDAVAPIKLGRLRLIDCGAVFDGYLAAYCCETDDHILQSTDKEDIKET